MLEIRIRPEDAPAGNLPLQQRLMGLFTRSAAMGVLSDQRVTKLDGATLRRLVNELQGWNLLRSATVDLAPLFRGNAADLDPQTARHMEAEVGKLVDVLDESPSPATEWATMREIFGDEALAKLVGVAEASLRRYASGTRETPQLIAERLHWLAMVVADLSGAYNAFGIRRWFERPRSQLGGRSPRESLGADWKVDDEAAARVRALAAALSGAQPLAA
jgi:hypothetical protein